jgi:peptidyl-prolyl cis-trans isomerase A (cyclophilin A)
VASIIQRILGLGFLMASVMFGMTLAQSQMNQQATSQSAPPAASIPTTSASGAALTPEQMAAAAAYLADQRKAEASFGPGYNANAPYPYSGSPIRPPGKNTHSAPEKFVPSEVEIFQSSLSKHIEPRAIVHTTLGDVELKLFSTLAPRTVRNFIELARGEREFSDARTSKKTRRPFYNGLTVHKVVSGEYLQMGCPMGNGRGGPGYTIPDELAPQLKFDRPYMVGMAAARDGIKAQKDSNGSQFFITLRPHQNWDGRYTIFGEVIKGQKILDTISSVDVGPTDRPIRKVFITAVDIIDEEGSHPPAAAPMEPVSQPGPASVGAPIAAPASAPAPDTNPAPGGAPAAPAAGGGGLAIPPQ